MFDFTIGYFRFYDKNFEKNVYNVSRIHKKYKNTLKSEK